MRDDVENLKLVISIFVLYLSELFLPFNYIIFHENVH